MERIALEIGEFDRLDVHFGVGAELQVVGVGSDGGSCQAALVNWTSTSHPLRQVTVEAGPSLSKLHAAQHTGYVDSSQEGLQEVATAISVALSNATAEVQELEADSQADAERLELVQHLAAARVAAVWDLLDCLLFQDRGPHGYIAEHLARWATIHCNVLATDLSDSLVRQFGEMYSALQLTSGARESFGGGPACWFLLHQLLLTGDIQRAYMLLTAHLQSQSPNQITLDEECEHFVLENLAHNLMAMPRYSAESYSSMEMFHHQHSEWTSSLEQWEDSLPGLIARQFPEVHPPKELLMHVKETVLVCIADETARWRTSPSVLHFFLAHLLYAQPGQCLNSSLSGTLDVAVTMMEQRGQAVEAAPPLHKTAMQIIRAAAKHEPMQVLTAVNESSGSWVAAHATMLLYRDPQFADALDAALPLDEVGGGAQWQQHMCVQPGEFFALRAAADLATGHERLWRPVSTSLLSCKQAGRAGTISIAERWPCIGAHSADADAIALHLQSVALPECARAVKLSASMAALHEGRLAEALALAPPGDADSQKAFAPYLLAAMRQHAVSPAPLGEPPAVLITVSELAQAFVSTEVDSSAFGRAHARQMHDAQGKGQGTAWRCKSWECVVAYAKLCHACSALADVQQSSGSASGKSLVPKGGSTSTTRLRGAVQHATLDLLDECPADVTLRTLHKLRPLMLPEQEIFSSSDLHLFVQWMHDACMHGGQDAQLQTAEGEIRTELLTACVLTTTA